MNILQTVSAQAWSLDSLQALLPYAESDTARASLLIHIAAQMVWTDWSHTSTAKQHLLEAQVLLRETPYSPLRGRAYSILGKIYRRNSQQDSAYSILQKGIQEAEQVEDNQQLSELFSQLAGLMSDRSRYDSALLWYQRALIIDQTLNDSANILQDFGNLANTYGSLDSFVQARFYYQQIIDWHENNATSSLANAYSNLGILLYQQGLYDSTAYYFIRARELWEDLGDPYYVAVVGLNIGTVFTQIHDYPKAYQYFQQVIPIFDSLGHKAALANTYNNLGSLSKESNHPDSLAKSNGYHVKALAIREEIQDSSGMASSLNNLGGNFVELGQAEQAIPYLKRALQIKRRLRTSQGKAMNLYNLGLAYYSLENYEKAHSYFLQSLEQAKSVSSPNEQRLAYQGLADVAIQLGSYRDAYTYRLAYHKIQDSLFSVEKERQIQELEIHYQTEKKQATIDQLAQQQEIDHFKIQRQQSQIILLLLFMGLSGLIVFLLQQRNRLRHQQQLNEQLLHQQELRLQHTIETQETERSRIARDLHDGLGQLLSAVRMQLSAQKADTLTHAPSLEMLDQAVSEVRMLAHTMMPRSLQDQGLESALKELFSQTARTAKLTIRFEALGVKERLSQAVEIGLYRIAQELLSNVIKHAHASQVEVQLNQIRESIILTVEDDGIGIPTNLPSTGMGMRNIRTRAEAINGSFRIEKGPIQGSIATIKVPLAIPHD
ncbi:MAG: sensor histidine kinase [Bacteroidota bacterium]